MHEDMTEITHALKNDKFCQKMKPLIPLGFEPRTSRVLGERDNHYTMESALTI